MAELGVAKELGLTLRQLRREMTQEEVYLWVAYLNLINDEQEAAMEKARRKRR